MDNTKTIEKASKDPLFRTTAYIVDCPTPAELYQRCTQSMSNADKQTLGTAFSRGLSPDELVVITQLGGFKLTWGWIPEHHHWLHEWLLALNSYNVNGGGGGDCSFVIAWVNGDASDERITHCLFAEYSAPRDFDAEYQLLDEEPGSISLWDEHENDVTEQYESAPPPRYWLCRLPSPPISPLNLALHEKGPPA